MKSLIVLTFVAAMLGESCQTYTSANGGKYRQLNPAKDKTDLSAMDTGRFIRQRFDLSDFTNKVAFRNRKRIIVPVEGSDVRAMVNTNGRYYLYFWNPGCPATRSEIHKMDSIAQKGESVMIISLRSNYEVIDTILGKKHFSQYPWYTLEADRYTSKLVVRKIRFIKEACPTCYEQYKDDLAVADYLLLENGTTKPVMYNDSGGINIFNH